MGGGCEGFNTTTAGSWSGCIDGNKTEVVQGNKSTWTNGCTFDFIKGNKIFQILGPLHELFLAFKFEEVYGRESKLNVGGISEIVIGGKAEMVAGVATEIHIGPKYHIGVAGQGRLISEDKLTALENRQLINAYRARVGQDYERVTSLLENFATLARKVSNEKDRINSLRRTIGHLRWEHQKANYHMASFNHTVSGDLKHEVGVAIVKSKGDLKVEGSSVKLDGGGTVEIGGTLSINGSLHA